MYSIVMRQKISKILFKVRFYGAAISILIIFYVVYLLCFQSVVFNPKDGDDRSLYKQNEFKENELLNLTNFRYTIQPTFDGCHSGSVEIDAIIVITTAIGNHKIRSRHRTGISNEDLIKMKIVRIFLLGSDLSHSEIVTQKALQAEHKQFNDIVQGNFLDSYHNLSYKSVMGLNWSSSHPCLNTKFIIKVDDDFIVDFIHLTQNLIKNHYIRLQNNKTEHLLGGIVHDNILPSRGNDKWRVSYEEYAASYYPPYLLGCMWITTPYTARSLISATDRSTPIYWIEDVWITGILREKADIPLSYNMFEPVNAYYNKTFLECCVNDLNKFGYRCPLATMNAGNDQMIELLLKATHTRCYNMTSNVMNDHCIERDLAALMKSCQVTPLNRNIELLTMISI